MISCSSVDWYERFGGMYPEGGGGMFHRNVGTLYQTTRHLIPEDHIQFNLFHPRIILHDMGQVEDLYIILI
jgi:hypothetical protein